MTPLVLERTDGDWRQLNVPPSVGHGSYFNAVAVPDGTVWAAGCHMYGSGRESPADSKGRIPAPRMDGRLTFDMFPVCSFCGERPVVAWFEGPDFKVYVSMPAEVRSEEAWLCCSVCLRLVEAEDHDALFRRGARRLRQAGNPASTIDLELQQDFWRARSRER